MNQIKSQRKENQDSQRAHSSSIKHPRLMLLNELLIQRIIWFVVIVSCQVKHH